MKLTLSKQKIINIFLCIIVILFSGHSIQTTMFAPFYLFFVIGAFSFLWLAFCGTRKTLKTLEVSVLLFLLMVFCTFLTEFGGNAYTYFLYFSYISTAYYIVKRFSFDSVVKLFLKIMTWLTIIALIGYVLVNNTELLSSLPTITNLNGVEYKTAIVFNYIPSISDRNCGMFWEPGIFATYLSLAIIFELVFKKDRTSIFRILIFSIGIITANSSAGFALLPLTLLLFLTKSKKNNNVNFLLNLITIIIIIAIVMVFFNLDALIQNSSLEGNEYLEKLFVDNLKSQSRVQALEHNISIFLNYPLFGAGFSYVNKHMQYVSDTSTCTYLLSIFGILGSLYTILWIVGIFRQKHLNIISKLLIFTIMLFVLNKEPHAQILFTWCLLFYFLKSDNLRTGERISF